MPELPEVETTIRELRRKIIGLKIKSIWCGVKKLIKRPKKLDDFEKEVKGKKIEGIKRRGKNILINLSQQKIILIHQKMTGHLLVGKWKLEQGKWISQIKGPLLYDPQNRFLHLIFFLSGGLQLALSDQRKFAKVELWEKEDLKKSPSFINLGIEPFSKNFTFVNFEKSLQKRKKGKIKQILMDQNIIAGIGNIYSDEILWKAKINPLRDISKLSQKELKKIYSSTKEILTKAIRMKGTSISDFRRTQGRKGSFQSKRKVYRKEGQMCPWCQTEIKRIKLGSRSAHFCPKCQK
jgi:formamidopyrimidine-DNA glycosylase